MNLKKILLNNNLKSWVLICVPILIVLLIVFCRNIISPSNEEIINDLKNTKYYSSKVDYKFINSKSEFIESTMQYYSVDQGSRIEFLDDGGRIKVYKGSIIKVEGSQNEEFTLDNEIDVIYPLAFIQNILSNTPNGEIKEVQGDWDDQVYLKLDFKYNIKNKHLDKAEFYICKNKKIPVLLKILDENDKERVVITFTDFKREKKLNNDLF